MNWSEQNIQEMDLTDAENKLFIGDTGELSLDTRRALVQLLIGPAVEERRFPKLWSIIVRDEVIIRRRLSELFLNLILDQELKVAFIRQAELEDLEAPILLRRVPLTFLDSALLLYLRQQLMRADAQGERTVVAVTDIEEYLSLYERSVNTDHAGFRKRVHATIEKMKKYNILNKIRASEDRFEISPTLKLLFSAEEIQALTHWYQSEASHDE